MRPGPARGETATLDVTVTPAMAGTIGGGQIHPVYGLAALTTHVEEVCRDLLLPHLGPGEEGVGCRIDMTQRAAVPIGAAIVLTAEVARVDTDVLICEVTVRQGTAMVARGSFEQRVVISENFHADVTEREAVVSGPN